MLNSIRKIFRLRLFEGIFVFLLKYNIFTWLAIRLIPSNGLYPPNSFRTVNRNGINFQLDLSDYQDWIIFYYSKIDSSEEVLNYIDENAKTIIDIGGNIGQTSLYIAQKYATDSSRIISFEPYPSTHNKFIQNLNLNPQYKKHIHIEFLGLGEEENEFQMFKECATNSGGNRIVYEDADQIEGLEKVAITTLDKYVEKNKINQIDFIKIDIEGYEFAALSGGIKTLQRFKPDLFLEMDNGNLEKQGSSSLELFKLLKPIGYSFTNVTSGQKISAYSDIANISHFDMFCKFHN